MTKIKIATPRLHPNALAARGVIHMNGFTLGKKYSIVRTLGTGAIIKNDNGHERFILLDGSPSPHIVSIDVADKQILIGHFDIEEVDPCQVCADHYQDEGVCDEGKPVNSPHRQPR